MLQIKSWKLNKGFLVNLVALLLLVLMFFLAVFSSKGIFSDPGDSATMDELAHIPAGYTYIKSFDYRLNPEHPPLAKILAAIPLLLDKSVIGPENDLSFTEDIDQWSAGRYMLYGAGNNPEKVLFLSRLPMIFLMLLLGLFLFKWSKELFGAKVGLVVLSLYVFYPDIIAHGRLVTTDIAAAFGYVSATYFFDKALKRPNIKSLLIAAIFLAVAQLLKFSAILLFVIFIIYIILKFLLDLNEIDAKQKLVQNLKSYFVISLLSILFVWIFYIPFVSNTPAKVEHQVIENNLKGSDNRLIILKKSLHHLEDSPILRGLSHYALGVSQVIGRVEGGSNTYILNRSFDKGIWWYFLVAWLLKTPLSIIILFLTSIIFVVVGLMKKRFSRDNVWLLILLIVPIAVYWAFTIKGSLNIGIRHLIPTIPFVLLLIGFFVKEIFKRGVFYHKALIIILVAFLGFSILSSFPHFLAYFNELVPENKKHHYLTDSSLDWGQDLLRLKKYIEDNNINEIKIDYFGGSSVEYYLSNYQTWSAKNGPTTGLLAISATDYQASKITGLKNGQWSYDWLDGYQPIEIIGDSILIFDIKDNIFKNNPPTSSYPIEDRN